jgi:hypothetical protein
MELVSLGGGAGFLKAGLLGFAGSGKTFTAAKIAAGVRAAQGLQGPIAMLDTEAAAQYIAPMVRKETGLDLVGVQTRALKDAIEFLRSCHEKGVSVAILDSVTHLWREVCDSYLKQVNEALEKKGRAKRSRLEFQDWGPIKAEWEKFSNLYLNIPMHVIICGRAGYDYDYEDVEGRDDGKKQLVKTGVKMKTEGEFGYEPSLLIQMERFQKAEDGSILPYIVHRATVIKDRFGTLDGKSCDNPDFTFFRPFVDLLTPGKAVAVDTSGQTDLKVDESGDAEWQRERKLRVIYCEEIQGKLTAVWPGQSADEKKQKVEILHRLFETRSWTAVESLRSEVLKTGLDRMDAEIASLKAGAASPEAVQPEEPKSVPDQLPVSGAAPRKASRKAQAVAR